MSGFEYKDWTNNKDYKEWRNVKVTTSWEPNNTQTNGLTDEQEAAKMREMLNDLTRAVLDFGPNKAQAMKVLVRHRTEWPHLWDKIDVIMSYIAEKPEID